MSAHHLSASKLALAHACSWSFRADAPQYPRPSGSAARIGTLVHKFAEGYVKRGQSADDLTIAGNAEEVTEAKALFSAPVRKFLDSTKWTACEIGLRYDTRTDTTKIGPRRGEPDYDVIGTTEIPMTLDLVHFEDGLISVVDLKSGKLVDDREQLYGQAVAAARLYGADRARVAYAYARKTKCDPPKWEALDSDALDMHAGRLSRLMRRLPMVEPVAGDYCWKCDSRPACPAFGAEQANDSARELEAAGFFA